MAFKFNSDRIISYSAIVVALASMVVSVWQGAETRKHNRLSVRPRIGISFDVSHTSWGYSVKNNGLGPAIVTGKVISVDGDDVSRGGFSGYEGLYDKLELNDFRIRENSIGPGTTIQSGEVEPLIQFRFDEMDEIQKQAFIQSMYHRISIKIEYRSMYNEDFVCSIPR